MARILVVDDEEPLRGLLIAMLNAMGHTTVGAANGFEAVKFFRADPAGVILTDITMPYDGLAAIRILSAEFPHVGIIAMSGSGVHRLDFARSVGAHRTLAKPFTAQELSDAIAAVLAEYPEKKPTA